MIFNAKVMLYKSFNGEGFNILSEEFKMLQESLGYVHLKDVSFIIYPDRKEVMEQEDKRTVHALAVGTILNALPLGYKPSAEILQKLHSLPELDYNPYTADHFYLKTTLTKVEYAAELFAFNNQVKIIL